MQDQNRVVIAGMGLARSAGAPDVWAGHCSARYLRFSDPELAELLPGINLRAVDRSGIFAGIAVRRAIAAYLERGGLQPETTGVVLGTTFGATVSIGNFYRQALRRGFNAVSPMEFPNTVANASASRVGIWFQFKGPNVTLADGWVAGLDAVDYAFDAIRHRQADYYLAADMEVISDALLWGYAATARQSPSESGPVRELLGEGGGALYLCSWEAALAADYRIYAEIAGCYSGGTPLTADWGRRMFAAVETLLAEAGMRRADTVVYTAAQPFNPAAGLLLEAAERQFGPDRVITPNREGDDCVCQYFGLNGIIHIMQAVNDLRQARYQNKGAVVVEVDWDGRFAAVLLKTDPTVF
jgi:3-oxoacyl-(acyl-carrier-protein) synthase